MNVLAVMIGENLANMHKGDNIHGDLTTSNMMIKSTVPSFGMFDEKTPKPSAQDLAKTMSDKSKAHLYLIDFGLSFFSMKVEDKATDIYVLKRAFLSTHPNSEEFFEKVLACYKEAMPDQKGLKIIAKFKEVELRGRKRTCFG